MSWVLAAALVVLGALALSSTSKPKCPYCKTPVVKGTTVCPNCRSLLRWDT